MGSSLTTIAQMESWLIAFGGVLHPRHISERVQTYKTGCHCLYWHTVEDNDCLMQWQSTVAESCIG